MIEAVRICAVSGDEALWEDLDLVFADGEAWVVTGPPSCGKTVLLRILRGERRPDTGEVLVDGKSLYRNGRKVMEDFRAAAGFVPEHPPVRAGKTVQDLFRLSALLGVVPAKERRDRETELLAMIGLPGTRERDLATLSTSELSRAVLAAELIRSPRYLFADGLLASVGNDWTDRLAPLLRALAREGKTVVLSERMAPGKLTAGDPEGTVRGPFRLHRVDPAGGRVG
jgi:ABC-type multidrug transport system ATPase subunit